MSEIANATFCVVARAIMSTGKDAIQKDFGSLTGWENHGMIVTRKHPIGNPTLIARSCDLKAATSGTGNLKSNKKNMGSGSWCSGHFLLGLVDGAINTPALDSLQAVFQVFSKIAISAAKSAITPPPPKPPFASHSPQTMSLHASSLPASAPAAAAISPPPMGYRQIHVQAAHGGWRRITCHLTIATHAG